MSVPETTSAEAFWRYAGGKCLFESRGEAWRDIKAWVSSGKTVTVVGDGAVGMCGVIAASRLGAEQIIIMGRHPDRIALAKEFGATDVVSERGDEAVERVRELDQLTSQIQVQGARYSEGSQRLVNR
jgi:threonine dehydrogenase-like Zn-dependent dehydrogenase